MTYFVMTCEGLLPAATVEGEPDPPGPPWMTGTPVEAWNMPANFNYRVDPKRKGPLKPFYDSPAIPLMRRDLKEALLVAGVDNVEFFPAILEDSRDGIRHDEYDAFNVIGLVSATDQRESAAADGQVRLLDTDFASLTLSPEKASGLLLFRLAENASAIVVHESIRQAVEQRAIPGMTFYGPGEWAG
jgi:hypothetical protein